ncbi:NUDIX domain-containing protein [Dictyobacter kobayashii]|uniref:Nudix hydrolase domain-containing protein n=1 Tax=Dictyobacter kobayashii TaxID=2014872 RepID=A0A402AU62_9CHLR|nr:NUDIX domain-containing protein [Dictyobacter kobayashii]GCE22660.1 hypothetical protein KDK_64600 [Dictyobacter kobayashii]
MSQNIYDNIRTRVIVLQENQILLLNDDGTWRLPGGGLEPYESLLDCAAREVREETGIEVEATSIAFLGEWIYPTYAPCPHKRMHYGYTLEVHVYAHPIRAGQTLQQEGPDFPIPAWIPLATVPQLPLWPKELKTLATTLLAGEAVPGVPSIIRQLESPQTDPPVELAYTQIAIPAQSEV